VTHRLRSDLGFAILISYFPATWLFSIGVVLVELIIGSPPSWFLIGPAPIAIPLFGTGIVGNWLDGNGNAGGWWLLGFVGSWTACFIIVFKIKSAGRRKSL